MLCGLMTPLAQAAEDGGSAPAVQLTGMTFLASTGSQTQLRLEAETAETLLEVLIERERCGGRRLICPVPDSICRYRHATAEFGCFKRAFVVCVCFWGHE